MRIAQVTTTLQGGAGIAAIRLSEALNRVGVDSSLVSQRIDGRGTSLRSKATSLVQSKLIQKGSGLITSLSIDAIRASEIEEFDLLHFHSIYNLTSTENLLKLAERKNLVFTLHDQRLFTGGCHYSGSCVEYAKLCTSCPQVRFPFQGLVIRQKKLIDMLTKNSNINFISPSAWLAGLAEKAILKSNLHIIRNPIPEYPKNNSLKAKEEIGIDSSKYVIGFVSVNLLNPLKGLKDLLAALECIPYSSKKKLHLLLVGKNGEHIVCREVESTLLDVGTLAGGLNPYSAMDLLVVPSRQDNSPNVIGEAIMNGVPVLGSQIGGVPEILRELGLPVVNTRDPKKLAEVITELIERRIEKDNLRGQAKEILGYEPIGLKVKALYKEILDRRST
jgi:glycosyltransferase involved in cell wall biosynthesis